MILDDPDGNGIEFAWDKPSADWPWAGDQVRMVTDPLPLRPLLAEGSPRPADLGAFHLGHIHLQVADLTKARAYCETLDLRVTQSDYPGAIFLARDRYHHHLALNTWRVRSGTRNPRHATGLVEWEMKVGESKARIPAE